MTNNLEGEMSNLYKNKCNDTNRKILTIWILAIFRVKRRDDQGDSNSKEGLVTRSGVGRAMLPISFVKINKSYSNSARLDKSAGNRSWEHMKG